MPPITPGQAVDRPQFGIGQGHAAHKARQGHIVPRANVASVGVGMAQRACGQPESAPAERARKFIAHGGHKRLQQLGQGIQSGEGRQFRGHGIGQFGVDDSGLRKHPWVAHADFDLMFRRRENGIAGDFRSGSRGGGNGNARRGPVL